MGAGIAASCLRVLCTSIWCRAVIAEAVRCSWLSVWSPLLGVKDTPDFGGCTDYDGVKVTLNLAHLFFADDLAEDAVFGHDALDAGVASQLLGEFTDASSLQEVRQVLVDHCNVAHFIFPLHV